MVRRKGFNELHRSSFEQRCLISLLILATLLGATLMALKRVNNGVGRAALASLALVFASEIIPLAAGTVSNVSAALVSHATPQSVAFGKSDGHFFRLAAWRLGMREFPQTAYLTGFVDQPADELKDRISEQVRLLSQRYPQNPMWPYAVVATPANCPAPQFPHQTACFFKSDARMAQCQFVSHDRSQSLLFYHIRYRQKCLTCSGSTRNGYYALAMSGGLFTGLLLRFASDAFENGPSSDRPRYDCYFRSTNDVAGCDVNFVLGSPCMF